MYKIILGKDLFSLIGVMCVNLVAYSNGCSTFEFSDKLYRYKNILSGDGQTIFLKTFYYTLIIYFILIIH